MYVQLRSSLRLRERGLERDLDRWRDDDSELVRSCDRACLSRDTLEIAASTGS